MTYTPDDLRTVRAYLQARTGLPAVALGVAGNDAHAATGGYHMGNDSLARVGRLARDYSKRQSARDRPGSDAASALDVGFFTVDCGGRVITLRTFTAEVVAACRRGDPRTRDIREVIWSPDGHTVVRWDREQQSDTGSADHREHSHFSFYRDSEGRRDQPGNFLGLATSIFDRVSAVESAPATASPQTEEDEPMQLVALFAPAAAGKPATWVFYGYAPDGRKVWRELTAQELGTANAIAFGSTTATTHARLAEEKARFDKE